MSQSNKPSWFRGIRGRLLMTAVVPVIGFGAVFAISLSGTQTLTKVIASAHNEILPNLTSLGEMRQARNKFGLFLWTYWNATSAEEKVNAKKTMHEAFEEITANFKAYEAAPFGDEEAKHFEAVKGNYADLFKLMKTTLDLVDQGTPESIAESKRIYPELAKNSDIAGKFARDTTHDYADRAKKENAEATEKQASVFKLLIFSTLACVFAIFGLLMWIAVRLSNSVGSIASRLTIAGASVASSVEQLNEAGNSLSQSSTEAAASLEETVAALEELTSMVQMNSDNAKQAAALSITSRDSAETGEREIQNLIQSMTGISQSSKKIEEIISVIDDIAFQTNLLALNASVEAARAGEQGKGFAVVAEAVRALAQRSASSAKDITSLIKESVAQIDNGSKIADQSGAVLSNIVSSIKKVSDLNNEIAAASSEQTTGIQQISKAMNQLDQASQSNAASAEEIAATSGEINNLATTAQDLTVELNNTVLGTSEPTTPPVTTHHHRSPAATRSASPISKKPAPTKKNNVIPMSHAAPKPASNKAADMIPFEDDERAKVGTTDGF